MEFVIAAGTTIAAVYLWYATAEKTFIKERIYPGNVRFSDNYTMNLVMDYEKTKRFIYELKVSLDTIQRRPTEDEMVTCLMSLDFDEKYLAFGILVMTGYFETPHDALSFCQRTGINLRCLALRHHFNPSIFKLENIGMRVDVKKCLWIVSVLLRHMRENNIRNDYAKVYVSMCRPDFAADLTVHTYIIANYRHFTDNCDLFDLVLNLFPYDDIISSENTYRTYLSPNVNVDRFQELTDTIDNFFIYVRKNVTLQKLLEPCITE